jgi:hypothetical protein
MVVEDRANLNVVDVSHALLEVPDEVTSKFKAEIQKVSFCIHQICSSC